MRTPLPKIEESRRVSKEKIDARVEAEREEVIAAIKASDSYYCRIKNHVCLEIRRELVAGGYFVDTHYTEHGTFTEISW